MKRGGESGPLRVALLGSTGSIGRQTVDVLEAHADAFRVTALATGSNASLLSEQAARFRPAAVALADESAPSALDLPNGTERVGGADALETLATRDDVDLVIVATGGVVSLRPVLAALRAGKIVATANKETLVAGGHLVMPLAHKLAAASAASDPDGPYASALAWLRPIDSEHSAIWQCLVGEDMSSVASLVLTASGGPFLDATAEEIAGVTPSEALRHPTWTMGAKITIDSATLANKGLEVIEAHFLFAIPYERIEVVVHPTSIVHGLVRFRDGAAIAHLGYPDMRVPISYALTYPARAATPIPSLDLTAGPLEFFEADMETFRMLGLARQAGERGGTYPCAYNAANEVAVAAFLEGRIGFLDIPALVADVLEGVDGSPARDLEELTQADARARGLVAAAWA
ncbi:MAG: 1-deoxy-D-xylulose-5-phosphate reductoisomerase [Chloroflexota bacterium]